VCKKKKWKCRESTVASYPGSRWAGKDPRYKARAYWYLFLSHQITTAGRHDNGNLLAARLCHLWGLHLLATKYSLEAAHLTCKVSHTCSLSCLVHTCSLSCLVHTCSLSVFGSHMLSVSVWFTRALCQCLVHTCSLSCLVHTCSLSCLVHKCVHLDSDMRHCCLFS